MAWVALALSILSLFASLCALSMAATEYRDRKKSETDVSSDILILFASEAALATAINNQASIIEKIVSELTQKVGAKIDLAPEPEDGTKH